MERMAALHCVFLKKGMLQGTVSEYVTKQLQQGLGDLDMELDDEDLRVGTSGDHINVDVHPEDGDASEAIEEGATDIMLSKCPCQ